MSYTKLIITDLDGTLLQSDMTISKANRAALQALEDAGIRVAAVTGRAYHEVSEILRPAGFDGLGVFDGGSIVVDCSDGRELWSQRIDLATSLDLIKTLAPLCNSIAYSKGDLDPSEVPNNLPTEPVLSIWARLPLELATTFAAEIDAMPGLTGHVGPTSLGPDWGGIHITHEKADKYHGVQAMLGFEHVPKENIAAIGDGNNDRPLFQNASVTFAMGNAADELKSMANHVVGDYTRDGWAEMVHKYIL